MTALESLIAAGTKLWLDSVDPQLVALSRQQGATGATSNPIIVADLIKSGRFDHQLSELIERGENDEAIAWLLTDQLVRGAQDVFHDAWQASAGDDGYVSFELDPLLEDAQLALPLEQRVERYLELGRRWSAGHDNRMIKVPATPAGLAALEELAAAGLTLNVTLIFSSRQYRAAREAIWRGRQRCGQLDRFKSVYSIFVSRIDVWSAQQVPALSDAAQGMVGIVNAKRIWIDNQQWWASKKLKLSQEIVFASTGVKNPNDEPDKYVAAFAGSDIQTNPPATNDAVQRIGRTYRRTVDQMPPAEVLDEIDAKVDFQQLEEQLMAEGVKKFADPQKELIQTIAQKRARLSAAR